MRKAIALVLLLALGTMPLQTSAQVSVPAVDLQCLTSRSSEGPLIFINLSETVLNDTAICTVTNPNTYAERIRIGVSADGLGFDAPVTIDMGPNSEESFNVTVSANQSITPGIRMLNVTASVSEANGASPPNTAESYTEGEIWIVNDEIDNTTTVLQVTEIGPFENTVESFTMSNSIEYPVLYLKESFHIDAILTDWNGSGLSEKCLNIYVDPEENASPVITVNTSENGTIEWFSADRLQNPSLRGIETTRGKLEGLRTIRVEYEPNGGIAGACNAEPSGDLQSTAIDIDVLVKSRTELLFRNQWTPQESYYHLPYRDPDAAWFPGVGSFATYAQHPLLIEGEPITGDILLKSPYRIYEFALLPVENEIVYFLREYWSENDSEWIIAGQNESFTNSMGVASFNWSSEFIDGNCQHTNSEDTDALGYRGCTTLWRITAYFPGSMFFAESTDNYSRFFRVEQYIDSDGDGFVDRVDAFPNDPDETHDDDNDGVGNNNDVFPQDPDEQFDNDGDGIGNNADEFPDNPYASDWSSISSAVGTLLALLIITGVIISRMKKQDELPTVGSSRELQQLDNRIEELQHKKNEMTAKEDVTDKWVRYDNNSNH